MSVPAAWRGRPEQAQPGHRQPPIIDMDRAGLEEAGLVDPVAGVLGPDGPAEKGGRGRHRCRHPAEGPARSARRRRTGSSAARRRRSMRRRLQVPQKGSGDAGDQADLPAPVDEAEPLGRRRARRLRQRLERPDGRDAFEDLAPRHQRCRSHFPCASSGMNSMKRTTRPVSRAKAAKSRISSSLLPRRRTTLTLSGSQAGRFGGVHGLQDDREMSPAPDGGEAVRAQRVTADVDPAQPGPRPGTGAISASADPLVVMARSSNPSAASRSTSEGSPLAHERFAAGEADGAETPSPWATRATRVISSKLRRSSCGGRNSPSSGMQ